MSKWDVQETGAANFLLIDGNEIITKALDSSFLHGVICSSIFTIAKDLGMIVIERDLTVRELLERSVNPGMEAVLFGTAVVLTSVGTFIHNGKEFKVGSGKPGSIAEKLRTTLNDIHWGNTEDQHTWLTKIT